MTAFVLLAFLLAPPQGLTVFENPGVSGPSLQEVVDQAPPGEVVLIRTSLGTLSRLRIVGKGLTLIVDEGAHFLQWGGLDVVDLPAAQHVSLVGMKVLKGLSVSNCAGNVWIQDCDLENTGADQPGLLVQGSGRVVVLNSSAVGGSAPQCSADPDASVAGGPGARLLDSGLSVYDSVFQGGAQGTFWYLRDGFYRCVPLGPGGAGVFLSGAASRLLLAGTTAIGGAGACTIGAPSCPCEDGAPGLHVESGVAYTLDSRLEGGPPGAESTNPLDLCNYHHGTQGPPSAGEVDSLRGKVLRLTAGTPARAGGVFRFEIQGPPGVLVALAVGSRPLAMQLIENYRGTVLTGGLSSLAVIGITGADGRLTLDLPVGELPGLDVEQLYVQVGYLDLNGPRSATTTPKAVHAPVERLLGGGALLVGLRADV